MFTIEKKDYGVKLTFGGAMDLAEMTKWVAESEKMVKTLPSKFGVFVDMRELKPLSADVQAQLQKGQTLFKMKGMERSVVILHSVTLKMQFKRLAQETGIYQWERYIDTTSTTEWEKIGIKWLTSGVDPVA